MRKIQSPSFFNIANQPYEVVDLSDRSLFYKLLYRLYTNIVKFRQGRSPLHHLMNRKRNKSILSKHITGKEICIIGSGPSTGEVKALPADHLVMTCNYSLKFLYDKGIFNCDFILLNGIVASSIIHDPLTRDFFLQFSFNIMVVPSKQISNALRKISGLKVKHLIIDDIWDNSYLRKLIAPTPFEQIIGNAKHRLSSSGIRLLQYALYFRAKRIAIAGIDMNTNGYFYNITMVLDNIHLDIDRAFFDIVSKKHDTITSLIN